MSILIIDLPEYISISSKLKSESTSILICLRLLLVSSNPTLSSPEKIVFIQLSFSLNSLPSSKYNCTSKSPDTLSFNLITIVVTFFIFSFLKTICGSTPLIQI